VRLALASALPHLSVPVRSLVAQHLLRFDQDATDHNLPLLVWTGLRELPFADLIDCAHISRIPQVTQLVARRIAEGADKDPASLNQLLANAAAMPECQAEIVAGVAAALRGWRKAPKPAAWETFVASIPKELATAQDQARQLNVIFGDGQALDEIRRIALDDKALMEQRRAALLSLIEAKDKQLKQVCEKLIYVKGVNMEAIQGLTQFDQDGVAQRIIDRYTQFYPHERPQIIMALVSRPRFAADLLKAVEAGKIPKADFGPAAARQARAFNDAKLNALLGKVWGETRETSADKLRLVAELKARHTPESLAKADLGKGRALYAGVCGQCHKLYGEGGALGPDLTGSGRHDLNYLIENIVDPSAVVDAAYYLNSITLKDGRVLSGIVGAQSERTLTLRAVGQETVIDKQDINSRQTLPVSLMPEGLLQAFTPEQQRDLLAYLMGNSQVPTAK
jgi:putative heme-binding domain-containing protein